MKNILYTFILGLTLWAVYAFLNPSANFKKDSELGIQFHRGSWADAVELAKKENKLVFLDVYATWCGPCKRLKSKSFSNEKVGKYFNEHFINVSLDGESVEGEPIASRYAVSAYPALYFIDASGNVVAKGEGYHSAGELLELGKSTKK